MKNSENIKAVVSVAEMARMVGLSRARFYQLMGSAFPEPHRDEETGRPYYNEDQQQICLEVRRRNCGVDGKPILFYARRGGEQSPAKKRKPNNKPNKKHAAIIEAIKSLGLASVTNDQVSKAVAVLFPSGIQDIDQSEVIRAVFVHIQRQNSTDNVG